MELVLEFWHWWALALIFVVVEALLLSGVFVALGVAGLITGIAFYVYPDLGWRPQLVIFGSSTVVTLALIRSLFSGWLNKNAEEHASTSEMIGKELVLKLPIQNGFGEIEIDGKNWALKGADQKAGTTVKVIGVDSYFLNVRPIRSSTNSSTDPTSSTNNSELR